MIDAKRERERASKELALVIVGVDKTKIVGWAGRLEMQVRINGAVIGVKSTCRAG